MLRPNEVESVKHLKILRGRKNPRELKKVPQ